MKNLKDSVAVVTGAASGIGRGLCSALLDEGATVVLADVEEAALTATVAELSSRGEALGVVTDVSSQDSVEALAAQVFTTYGACHLLFNNAAVMSDSRGGEPWEQEANDWQWTFGVNVFGVAHCVRAFVPRMIASDQPGWIVNTASGDGGLAPAPSASVYSASKAAMSCYTESLAVRLSAASTKIGASLFIPSGGLMETRMWTSSRNRPRELEPSRPQAASKFPTFAAFKTELERSGKPVHLLDLHELGKFVVSEVKNRRYVIAHDKDDMADLLHDRATALAGGELGPNLAAGLSGRRAGLN